MGKILTGLVLIASLLISGCGTGLFSVYKPDVQQGNALEDDRIAQLETGMTRSQVRFLLGEPVLRDPFHGERRWEYMYYLKPGDGAPERRRLTVHFDEADRVARFDDSGLK
ncbi:MAG: outer membrane protein assembly factor BamE [Thioalkalivibrio sp.]